MELELEFIDYMTDTIFSYDGELHPKLINKWAYEWIDKRDKAEPMTEVDVMQLKRDRYSVFVELWEAMTGRDYSNYIEEIGD